MLVAGKYRFVCFQFAWTSAVLLYRDNRTPSLLDWLWSVRRATSFKAEFAEFVIMLDRLHNYCVCVYCGKKKWGNTCSCSHRVENGREIFRLSRLQRQHPTFDNTSASHERRVCASSQCVAEGHEHVLEAGHSKETLCHTRPVSTITHLPKMAGKMFQPSSVASRAASSAWQRRWYCNLKSFSGMKLEIWTLTLRPQDGCLLESSGLTFTTT